MSEKLNNIVERLRALGFEAQVKDEPSKKPGTTWPAPDWAELSEKEFEQTIDRITNLDDLAGVANRRKLLNAPALKRWADWQRQIIINKKIQLEGRMQRRTRR